MPVRSAIKRARHDHPKRHGRHQRHTKSFLRVYSPYIPLFLIVLVGLIFGYQWQPHQLKHNTHGVLAYATEMSVSNLLQATNSQRGANGVHSLSLNAQLDQAAQAKANDMAARDYWSHNTPEGNPPWVFIQQAGYAYTTAGENLAYGFATSADTVTGWMNSPPHRENLLNSSFVDVGFGIANSANYQSSGPETIVVAMYGAPQTVAAAPSPPPAAVAKKTSPPPAAPTPAPQPSPAPVAAVAKDANEAKADNQAQKAEPIATNSSAPRVAGKFTVTRLEAVARVSLPWLTFATGLLSGLAIVIIITRHGLALRRVLLRGERYLAHHQLVLDLTLLSFAVLCYVLTRSAGFIL